MFKRRTHSRFLPFKLQELVESGPAMELERRPSESEKDLECSGVGHNTSVGQDQLFLSRLNAALESGKGEMFLSPVKTSTKPKTVKKKTKRSLMQLCELAAKRVKVVNANCNGPNFSRRQLIHGWWRQWPLATA